MAVVSGQVEVLDPIGLHARPAGQIVKLVKDSGLDISLRRDGQEPVKANSALRLMAMKIKNGETLVVEVETDDHEIAQSLIAQIQEFMTA